MAETIEANRVKIFFWSTVEERIRIKQEALRRGIENYTELVRIGLLAYLKWGTEIERYAEFLAVATDADRLKVDQIIGAALRPKRKGREAAKTG